MTLADLIQESGWPVMEVHAELVGCTRAMLCRGVVHCSPAMHALLTAEEDEMERQRVAAEIVLIEYKRMPYGWHGVRRELMK